jgi:hypothetical protein
LLCETWIEVGKDPICGVEKKGGLYWRRVRIYFHESREFKTHISVIGMTPLWKRGGDLSKQSATSFVVPKNMLIKDRPMSDIRVGDLVRTHLI